MCRKGSRNCADLWKAPVTDYNFGGESSSMTVQIISYIGSGLLGILIVGMVIFAITKLRIRNGN